MLILDRMPIITYCDFRKFSEGEFHTNRHCNYFVLILMLEGTLIFHEDGQEIRLTKGQWYIQHAGGIQEGLSPSLNPYYFYVHFETPPLETKSANMVLKINKRGVFQPEYYMDSLVKLDHYKTRSNLDVFEYQRGFMSILKELIEEANQNATSTQVLLNHMLEFIENNYTTNNLPKELELRFQFSYTTLSKITKRYIGRTPVQYMTDIRLTKASALLKRTSQTIETIADAVGYSDLSIFFKAFKKYYGMPPGKYREVNKIYVH